MKKNRLRQQMKNQLSALFDLIVFDYDIQIQKKHAREFIELAISEQEREICLTPSCFKAFDAKKFQLDYEIAIVEKIREINVAVHQEFHSTFTKLLLASGLEYFNLLICRNQFDKRKVYKRLVDLRRQLARMQFQNVKCTGKRINTSFRYAVVRCLIDAFIESLI